MVSETRERAGRGFEFLPHTADKAIEAWGGTVPELFCAAAEGMFSLSEDLDAIAREQEWAIAVEADSLEDLLHAWLSELLWVAERDEAVPCEFEVEALSENPWRLRARARGGPAPRETPHTGAPVKAVTYHELRIWQQDGLWRGHVVFDV
jgi:SHS2 domain-containing protein